MATGAELVRALHAYCAAHAHHVVIYCVGGGSQAAGLLLGQPGGSAWLREIRIPYSKESQADTLQPFDPFAHGFVSQATAIAMADAAYRRALEMGSRSTDALAFLASTHVLGLGLTASLSTARGKRGEDRVHIATRSSRGDARVQTAVLSGTREDEERATCDLLLHALAAAILPDAAVASDAQPWPQPPAPLLSAAGLAPLREASTSALLRLPNGRLLREPPFRGVVFPGSFNPLHHGHEALADLVARRFPALPLAFELSMVNADKPALTDEEIEHRVGGFTRPVFITRAPLFVDKARLFPGCHFVLGADTAVRLVDAKYYAAGELLGVMAELVWGLGVKFVVSGRLDPKTKEFFIAREQVRAALPASMVDRGFVFLDEADFRVDVSSTELRAKQARLSSM